MPQHPQQRLLNSYHDLVNNSGKEVYQDLVEAFVTGLNPDTEMFFEQFPHPYREYAKAGARIVIDCIRLMAEKAEEDNKEEPPQIGALPI